MFFEGFRRAALKIIWNTGARVELLDEELLRAMKESGCWLVNIGVESGDPEVLSRCGKTSDLSRVETVLKLCAQVGIETEANFILGLPGETRDSVRRTGEFVRRIRDLATIANFAVLTPYPGTQVFKMAVNGEQGLGLRTREWRAYTKHSGSVLRHSSFTPEELRELQMQFYRMFYLSSFRKILQLLRFAFREGTAECPPSLHITYPGHPLQRGAVKIGTNVVPGAALQLPKIALLVYSCLAGT